MGAIIGRISRSDITDGPPSGGYELGPYYIRGLLQGAVRKGYAVEDILRAAQIDTAVYTDPAAKIDGQQFQRLVLTTRAAMNDEYMGFLDVQGKLEMGHIIGRASLKCQTLGHAIRKMTNLVNAIRNDVEIRVLTNRADGTVSITHIVTGLNDDADEHLFFWLTFYWAYKFKCWLIGQPIKLKEAHFASSRPPNSIDYDQAFNCPVHFDSPDNRVTFDLHYLDAPIIRTEVEFFEGSFLRDPADWFAVSGTNQSFSGRVEQLVIDFYREGARTPSLDVLADILCCSPRTLSRKLARENETFQRIKDKVRCNIARKLLLETEMSIADIADRLRFSEPSDFTRAFSSWMGCNPSCYRTDTRAQSFATQEL